MIKPTLTDANPRGMLKLYRQHMDEFSLDQARQFNLLQPSEKMELLFYMVMNTNKLVQYVHHLIEPQKAKTQGMPEPETVN